MTIYRLHQAIKERVERAVSEAGFQGLQVYIRNLPPLKYEGDADEIKRKPREEEESLQEQILK